MKKAEYIKKYGKKAYAKQQEQTRVWHSLHHSLILARARKWAAANPEKVVARNREMSRKGGKHYEKWKHYNMEGLRREKNQIRIMHEKRWRIYKQIIAPESQIHHEWILGTADYRGIALAWIYRYHTNPRRQNNITYRSEYQREKMRATTKYIEQQRDI